ncbi:MAG: sulfite exporter TauE/SafE family protein [Acidobacteria bacterium]|nr:sulfite exporter TauE/SafE family protein [Acidobacteriota bacterium]
MGVVPFDLPLPTGVLLVAAAVTALAAALQGVVGFGYAIVAVPLLSLLDPRLAPVPQILTALPLTAVTAWRERGHIDGRGAAWILVGRVPGLALGAVLVAVASTRVLDGLIGASVLAGVACLSTRAPSRRTRSIDATAGALSGVAGYVSGIGGPPLALLYRHATGAIIRSTLGALFAFGIVVTVATRTVLGQITALDVRIGLLLLVPVLAGTWASRFLHDVVSARVLRVTVLALSALSGLSLLLRAWQP